MSSFLVLVFCPHSLSSFLILIPCPHSMSSFIILIFAYIPYPQFNAPSLPYNSTLRRNHHHFNLANPHEFPLIRALSLYLRFILRIQSSYICHISFDVSYSFSLNFPRPLVILLVLCWSIHFLSLSTLLSTLLIVYSSDLLHLFRLSLTRTLYFYTSFYFFFHTSFYSSTPFRLSTYLIFTTHSFPVCYHFLIATFLFSQFM